MNSGKVVFILTPSRQYDDLTRWPVFKLIHGCWRLNASRIARRDSKKGISAFESERRQYRLWSKSWHNWKWN